MCLTDEIRPFSGAIFKSPALDSLATRFTYEAMGYECLVEGGGFNKRAPIAEYKDEEVEVIQQAIFNRDDIFTIANLEDDLIRFEPVWRNLFEGFSFEVASFLGPRFELRLVPLVYDMEDFHFDKDFIIAMRPMGEGRESTICKDKNGKNIYSRSGEMVVTTPVLEHSWPVSKIPRLGLAATLYPHHLP